MSNLLGGEPKRVRKLRPGDVVEPRWFLGHTGLNVPTGSKGTVLEVGKGAKRVRVAFRDASGWVDSEALLRV